ncbi:hypothetical protein IEO21_06123 [Rhodonia placenta]|uniref:N2227-domain-containing protein n=1 Tax=Rhodonia placenta TaxID=104341 RepID=A0A8H7P0X2_9APHY|nr:hypothetical protein IEO21_06123 [Postia placenta]
MHMYDNLVRLLVSDAFLACLLPIVLSFVSLKLVGTPSFAELHNILSAVFRGNRSTPKHFSLERATLSYEQYVRLSQAELAVMRSSYGRLGRAHKRIAQKLGYPEKLDRLQQSILLNARVTDGIAGLARKQFSSTGGEDVSDNHGDLGRVRESLKHFVRDWSVEGQHERTRIFGPVLNVLKQVTSEQRASTKVLVPGSGLGRLAWEISQLGFDTTANELSFFMNTAFRFLLSEETTQHANQHVLQPYASWFSHQRTNDVLFRTVAFPDVTPRLSEKLHLAECDFLSLRPPLPAPLHHEGADDGYDYIVTLFFIDTSLNAIQTIEHIHALLRPGGTWINLGPLLWTGGGQAAVELSLQEMLQLAETVGFIIHDGLGEDNPCRQRTIECEYTADREAMMRWLYQAEFWVATKAQI